MLEKQILDIKDDVSNLYSLYTSSESDKKKLVNTSEQLKVSTSLSSILKVSPVQFLMTITASNPSVRQAKKVNQNFAKVYADLLEKEKNR